MRQKLLTYIVIAVALMTGQDTLAQKVESRNDSIATAIRLKGLQTKKEKLQNEIKTEDAKRNRQITGVSPETLEKMNDRQDSICLALRSELVDVILEIKEATPEAASPVLIQQVNNLINKPEPSGSASNASTGRKPSKKTINKPAKKLKK